MKASDIDAVFRNKISGALEAAMPVVARELLEIKKSYFSETGKEGWAPLKQETINRKARGAPNYTKKGLTGATRSRISWDVGNADKFNIEYGFLKNSLKIDYKIHQNELEITVEAHHRHGEEALLQLIDVYGRDFLRFDAKEIEFIKRRLGELIAKSFQ